VQESTNFQIYNASAGSGKTFTLVKEYLKILLKSDSVFHFQNVLAITFTNKAAAEMKERVLENLEAFSEGKTTDILPKILEETTLDSAIIKERSKKILDSILQNYSAFSITTIDSFTHKIIKSFAFDLGLSLNFEVEMDAVSLLNEAVEVLISKIGTDEKLTKLLINFTLDKADDDKSWDISRELNDFARILLSESDAKHFRKLSDKNIDDFTSLSKTLKLANREIENKFAGIGEKGINLIDNNGLDFADFSYKDLPNQFTKLTNFKYLKSGDLKFDGRLQSSIEANKDFYTAKTPGNKKEIIDSISEELKEIYFESKSLFDVENSNYVLNKLVLKNVIPLAVLNHINHELNTIKEENNIRLNAEFNQLIADQIKNEPAPFIYERIGQKFQHYFVDEMQDTSVLQWQNLIPLIENALSQEQTNLLLVGDGKQAIYRWRGGKAEQFIDLGNESEGGENPFLVQKEVRNLDTNYRSFSEVVNFNNSFFSHLSKFLQNEVYKNLFIDGNTQLENAKKGGFVSLNFLERDEENKYNYPQKVLEIIQNLDSDFPLGNICVLVRKNKDGVEVANYLSENKIEIVSSETLLLQNSQKVNFIIHFLQIIQHPFDEDSRFEWLHFLHQHLKIEKDKHSFFEELIHLSIDQLFQHLKNYSIEFDVNHFYQLPFYEKMEEIIRKFNLIETSDAYVQFFLDVVLEQQRKGTDVQEFLDFWEIKKEKLSIIAPENKNAVQIMTIHKSKGLEFPIVIFPYDLDIYYNRNGKVWLEDLPKENFENFDEVLVPYSKDLEIINDSSNRIYNGVREELELDNFNLLYVALTRSIEQLYVITAKNVKSNGEENTNFYSGIFINYLKEIGQWNDDLTEYNYGDSERKSVEKENKENSEIQQQFISTSWQEHNLNMLASSSKLWDTKQGEAVVFGNLIHEMMSKISTKNDIEKVISTYENQGFLKAINSSEVKTLINDIVNHPKLTSYFADNITIYNEREIVDNENEIHIPDRLIFDDNKVTIIDYKTGSQEEKHKQQILKYTEVLQSMNLKVDKKLLIYINDKILVEEV